ncbi:MAG TPA: CopG family ribbon-helix-helix protein [Stellaceae bacterium]|nr:CopG family ribbon-helix-helix protein [Stellaceae bacterium]
MRPTTLSIKVTVGVMKRLEQLAKRSGRSRSVLAAEAIDAYLDVNEWQIAGIKRAMTSVEKGEGVPHRAVKDWVASWGSEAEKPSPRTS